MILEWLNGNGWRVVSPIRYGTAGHEVPMGFESDGITLSAVVFGRRIKLRFLHMLIDRQGKALRAAVVHDYLYENAINDKAFADDEFLRIMRRDGVPEWKARLMHTAAVAFGRGSYQ